MWLFNKAKKLQAQILEAFGSSVEQETLNSLLDDPNKNGTSKSETRQIAYVLILVDEQHDVLEIINSISELALQNHAYPELFLPNLINITFNALPLENDPSTIMFKQPLIAQLIENYGSSASIVHGQGLCLFGAFGTRKKFGVIIPEFKAKLKKLVSSEYGSCIEINL